VVFGQTRRGTKGKSLFFLDFPISRCSESFQPGFQKETRLEESPHKRTYIVRLSTLPNKVRPHITRCVLAAALVGLSVLARTTLNDYFEVGGLLTIPFYPAAILAAYFGGLEAAVVATALSCIVIRYLYMQPTGQLVGLEDPSDAMRLLFFSAWITLIAFLFDRLQASKRYASDMASDAIKSRDQLREEQQLLCLLIDQQETEKQTLCNDFHDGLIQHVVGSKMLLEAHRDDLPADHPIHEVIHHLGKGIADGRRVIRGIRPSVLDEPGLSGCLHELIEHFSTFGFEVDVECCLDCDDHDVPDAIRTALFRICQEALTNSWKHSGCKKATVRIKTQGDWLDVEIDDDGCGIDAPRRVTTKGFGLKGMNARARLLGGSLDLAGKDKGTSVRLRLPLGVEQTARPTA